MTEPRHAEPPPPPSTHGVVELGRVVDVVGRLAVAFGIEADEAMRVATLELPELAGEAARRPRDTAPAPPPYPAALGEEDRLP